LLQNPISNGLSDTDFPISNEKIFGTSQKKNFFLRLIFKIDEIVQNSFDFQIFCDLAQKIPFTMGFFQKIIQFYSQFFVFLFPKEKKKLIFHKKFHRNWNYLSRKIPFQMGFFVKNLTKNVVFELAAKPNGMAQKRRAHTKI